MSNGTSAWGCVVGGGGGGQSRWDLGLQTPGRGPGSGSVPGTLISLPL